MTFNEMVMVLWLAYGAAALIAIVAVAAVGARVWRWIRGGTK